jgi:hypothetical protein
MNNKYLAILILITLSINAQQIRENFVEYQQNDLIKIVAPVGVTQKLLGNSFNEELKLQNVKAFNTGEVEITNEERYISELSMVENNFSFSANANFLGILTGEASRVDEKRFAILSVYHISKTATFHPTGDFNPKSKLFLKRIYYGWSIHYILSGSKSDFTSEAKAKLMSLSNILPNADINYTLGEFKLDSQIKLIGLNSIQNSPNIITNPYDVKNHFNISQKEVPIFTEYEVLTPFHSQAINFETTKFKADEEYRIKYIKLKISNIKPGINSSWDALGGKPDPFLKIFVNGELFFTSDKIQDNLDPTFNIEKNFFLKEGDLMQIGVIDKDLENDDLIGDAWISYNELINHQIGKDIDLKVRDGSGIKNIQIRFTPQK